MWLYKKGQSVNDTRNYDVTCKDVCMLFLSNRKGEIKCRTFLGYIVLSKFMKLSVAFLLLILIQNLLVSNVSLISESHLYKRNSRNFAEGYEKESESGKDIFSSNKNEEHNMSQESDNKKCDKCDDINQPEPVDKNDNTSTDQENSNDSDCEPLPFGLKTSELNRKVTEDELERMVIELPEMLEKKEMYLIWHYTHSLLRDKFNKMKNSLWNVCAKLAHEYNLPFKVKMKKWWSCCGHVTDELLIKEHEDYNLIYNYIYSESSSREQFVILLNMIKHSWTKFTVDTFIKCRISLENSMSNVTK
ncbi:Plasmodium exported protein (PHISTc), unknown function [Plasmodium sp. gorilla clade G2]|uniref:Plasmodium exported protein (PHISTc), unknown function n=1 Tax=Plasmodium sp. gorilla clade G2 TaxID=880535 RepID=UPI000D228E53|nr:Plasmodium exported protein (PHISTc), unknown function [Plasmodium sp. gorilla clade G2]SOV10455.1 Plasmodium exported protein (PHISTc), unknown function [Plasmodium sp. gorilla clade G2]